MSKFTSRFLSVSVAALALAACATSSVSQDGAAALPTEWTMYGGDAGGSNFSPLTQITPQNVSQLQRAWTWNFGAGTNDDGDRGLDQRWQVTPLLIDGVLYVSTPIASTNPDLSSTVTALVPETGEVLWRYESPRNIHARGLTYWPGDGQTGPRFFYGTDQGYLVALDIETHAPATGFGTNGEVDAYVGVVSERVGESKRNTWSLQNPLAVYENLIITSARPGEAGTPGPRSDIRAWDARTGELVWSFHTIPQPGEPYHDTYVGEEWQDRTGANVWSSMVVDEENGIVFAPLSNLNGSAEGPHLFAGTLMALNARTGERMWHFQVTHRDIWNTDMASPPVLVDFQRDGRTIPAVAITGKHGLFFVFDRLTGEPLFEIEERPTPRPEGDDLPWPTQPFPVRPGSLIPTGMTRADIPNITPEQYAYCTAFWDENDVTAMGVYSRPPTDRNVVTFPSALGGANWGGPSYNPETGVFVVNVMNVANYRRAQVPGQPPAPGGPNAPGFAYRLEDGTQLPCTPAPWGSLVAVDVSAGEILWNAPLGDTRALGEAGIGTGARNLGGNIQTASGLIFVGATNDRRFRAFDARTGALLWTTELEGSAHATPITFIGRDGRQYVVVVGAGGTAVGERRMSDTLNAFVLP